jgi:hypothetical protein
MLQLPVCTMNAGSSRRTSAAVLAQRVLADASAMMLPKATNRYPASGASRRRTVNGPALLVIPPDCDVSM